MAFDPNALQNSQPPQMGMPPPQQGGQPPDPDQTSQNQMPMDPSHLPPEQQHPGDPSQQQDQMQGIMQQLSAAIENKNLADKMSDEDLDKMSEEVMRGYKADLQSCESWLQNNRDWLEMSLLTRKTKSYPWPNASNIKHPLLATASMQFSARAYPTLVPADGTIVKPRVVGYDPDGSRAEKADRISKHMSFLIMHRIQNWEEDMDRLLVISSLAGIAFKKTYRDTVRNRIASKLVYPENLIVNYWANSIEQAYRKTEIVPFTQNEYQGMVNAKFYRDIGEIGDGNAAQTNAAPAWQKPRANQADPGESDCATPHIFLECHTFYDVDGDDYAEPVVITIHEETRKVVRVTARFASDSITLDDKQKKVVYIEPLEYYTDFPFFTNPDGSIYGLGFGALLGPITEGINTLANQLIDSGTLANLQGGFIAKGLRIQMKELKMVPGQWVAMNATGEDLKNGILPLPTKEPSEVLFKLMSLFLQDGMKLASVADIMVGKMPGQNTPATTTQETVDQSSKLFTAVHKRMYDALLSEFKKIRRLLSLSPDILSEESKILHVSLTTSDYDGTDYDIIPAADPSGSSQSTQLSQMGQIGQQLLPLKIIDPREFALRTFKIANIPDPEKLIMKPQPPAPPPPDPKLQQIQEQGKIDSAQAEQDMRFKAQEQQWKQQNFQAEQAMKQREMDMKEREMAFKEREAAMNAHFDKVKGQMDIFHTALENHNKLRAQETDHAQKESHQRNMNEIKAKAAASKPAAGTNG